MEPAELEVLAAANAAQSRGEPVLLATVVRTWGSSPRPPGAMMALGENGLVAGSVSGGCIEDDLLIRVRDGGITALAPRNLPEIARYGVDADEARRFGLPCGGTLELVLEPLAPRSRLAELEVRLRRREILRRHLDLASGVANLAPARAGDGGLEFDGRHLRHVLGPRHRLLVIGAGQLSRYLCETALGLGFDVTVCDPRSEYVDAWTLPGVALTRAMPDDAVAELAPDARTAVVALTHDPKLDDLALMDALTTPAFYVGALGSRANNRKRRQRLREHFGLEEDALARLRGPAGLYIGSRTPPEIALSILAEIVAAKNGVALPEQLDVARAKEAHGLSRGAPCPAL